MRLYLSSYRIGDYPEKIVNFAQNGRVAVIGNALDFIPDEMRLEYERNIYDPCNELAGLGLSVENLDLRKYFGRSQELARQLAKFGLVWVLGGNVFLLMRAMRQSGFIDIMRGLVQRDLIAYGGFSAGAIAATHHLRGLELMDDPTQLADQYETEVVWTAMGLVNFSIIPHYESDHPETHLADRTIAFMKSHHMPHLAMRDGEVYVFEDGHGRLYPGKKSMDPQVASTQCM